MSSRTAYKGQHAALVAVFTPSGHATRRVRAPSKLVSVDRMGEAIMWRTGCGVDSSNRHKEGGESVEHHVDDQRRRGLEERREGKGR